MRHRLLVSLSLLAIAVFLASLPVSGQSSLPSTPWGDPDLQGIWANNNATPLQRPEAFEGVVESTNFSPKSAFRGAAENLHLVERFTRVDADTIAYEITVEDPTTFTTPWTAMIPWKRTEDAIFEYACHEGNIGMEGMLAGHRAAERETAAQSGST